MDDNWSFTEVKTQLILDKYAIRSWFSRFLVAMTCLLGLTAMPVYAKTFYVKEDLELDVYRQPSTDSPRQGSLEAGQKVNVTASTKDGWAQVDLSSRHSGFVRTRFLSADKPTPTVEKSALEDEQKRAEALKDKLQDLREKAADAHRAARENEKYRQQIMELRADVTSLENENHSRHRRYIDIKLGAILILFGAFLGFLVSLALRPGNKNRHSL